MNLKYSRQINLNSFGKEGQNVLAKSRVLIVGAGGTSSIIIEYLVRMGVGNLRIVEPDIVSLSNLHRQILYTENDVSKNKIDILKKTLSTINSDTKLELIKDTLNKNNIENLTHNIDLIIDGVDSIKTKFLINKFSVQNSIPFIFSSVSDYNAQVLFVKKAGKPCLECLLGKTGNRQDKIIKGVFPPTIGLSSSLISSITIQYLLKLNIEHNFFLIDGKNGEIKAKTIKLNKECFCNKL